MFVSRQHRTPGLLPILVIATGFVTACNADGDGATEPAPTLSSAAATPTEPTPTAEVRRDDGLRRELLAMLRRDQADRTGEPADDETDQQRTDRLAEIVDQHGWPGFDLVGRRGEEAAWAIAQHSDLDPEFQAEALEPLREAVARGQASPGNLAYLEDRVAAAKGEPQAYGTQVGCGPDGPQPAIGLTEPARVDELRREAGLPPLAEYLAEMAALCEEE